MIRSRPLIGPPFFVLLFCCFFLGGGGGITQAQKKSGDKSGNLSKVVSVLLPASVERFFVSRMRDFFTRDLGLNLLRLATVDNNKKTS